jgi:hypothetical protein
MVLPYEIYKLWGVLGVFCLWDRFWSAFQEKARSKFVGTAENDFPARDYFKLRLFKNEILCLTTTLVTGM